MKERKASFEEEMKRLQKIVEELSAGTLSLGDSLKKYEEGVKLAQRCSSLLQDAQRKVELLTKKEGAFDLEEFSPEDNAEEK